METVRRPRAEDRPYEPESAETMRTLLRRAAESPAPRGRGVRAALLAMACVLLPLLGQAGLDRHLPGGAGAGGCIAVAGATLALGSRRRFTQRQAFAVLAGSQLAFHAAYSLPGACATAGLRTSASWFEHAGGGGHSTAEAFAGHVVAVLVAVRALGLSQRLTRPLRMLLTAARVRLLRMLSPRAGVLPALPVVPARGDRWSPTGFRAPPRGPARAPPSSGPVPRAPLRSAPDGGVCLVA